MKEYRNFWIALMVLAALTPVGLYLTQHFSGGSAWGEWGIGEVEKRMGYVPAGMEKDAGKWDAPLPEYAFRGERSSTRTRRSLSYLLSAIVGTAACGVGGYLVTRWLSRRR